MASNVETHDDGLKVTLECSKVGMTHIIGKGGSTIKSINAETGAKVDTESPLDGDNKRARVTITGPDVDSVSAARVKVEKILAEQESPDYEGPEGGRLRAEADAHAKERSRLMELADKQFADGDKSAGHESMAKAKEEGEKMRQVSEKAAEVIVHHRNDGKGDAYLDLHGLRTAEAEKFTAERLDALEAKGEDTELELIPGAGHHSAPGKVALKPAVEKMLKERGLAYVDSSPGSFTVSVKGKGTGGAPAAAAAGGATGGDAAEEDKKQQQDGEESKPQESKPEEKKKEEKKGGCCIVM